MKTYNQYLELITKNIIKKRREGLKSMKPETIAPEYGEPYEYDAYDTFNNVAYQLYLKGFVDIVPVRKYAKEQYFLDDIKNNEVQPMIKKIVFKEEAMEQITKLYITAKNKNK